MPKRIYAVRFANDDGSMETLASHLHSKESARGFVADEITKSHELPEAAWRALCDED